MASPLKLAHVVYQTWRFAEMVAWYEDVFEAHVVYQNPALAFLTYDDEHHRFAFANLAELNPDAGRQRGHVGINHVAYTYETLGDLLSTYRRLRDKGIHPYWPIHHGPTLSLYYQDPDGNRMELQVDACSVEEANRFMAGDVFAANPLGVVIDPDDLLARFEDGVPEKELLVRPDGPPSQMPEAHISA